MVIGIFLVAGVQRICTEPLRYASFNKGRQKKDLGIIVDCASPASRSLNRRGFLRPLMDVYPLGAYRILSPFGYNSNYSSAHRNWHNAALEQKRDRKKILVGSN